MGLLGNAEDTDFGQGSKGSHRFIEPVIFLVFLTRSTHPTMRIDIVPARIGERDSAGDLVDESANLGAAFVHRGLSIGR